MKTPKFVPTKAKQSKTPFLQNDVKRKTNVESINQLSKQSYIESKPGNIYMTTNVNIFEPRHLLVVVVVFFLHPFRSIHLYGLLYFSRL